MTMNAQRLPEATYDDYLALPDDQKAELIDGVIYFMSAPRGRHIRAASVLGGLLTVRFGLRDGPSGDGPGGWWILDEPEVHLRPDRRVVRPDLAGWRRERMPEPPTDSHKFTTVPDWVCEVLSPSTARHDWARKLPLYFDAGVRWVWMVDPVSRRIDAFEASDADWLDVGADEGGGAVALPPFDAIELDLTPCW